MKKRRRTTFLGDPKTPTRGVTTGRYYYTQYPGSKVNLHLFSPLRVSAPCRLCHAWMLLHYISDLMMVS